MENENQDDVQVEIREHSDEDSEKKTKSLKTSKNF